MNQITQREQEVLHLIAYEHSSKEIANRLYVSYETIISHRKNIMRKLEVKNVAGLVRVGFESGLLRAGMIALFLLCLPLLNQAQDSRMEITSTAGGSSSMEPLLILTSGQIKRAGIQFSESADNPSAGMSIEFNGRLDGGDNVFNINKADGSPHTQFFTDGRLLLRGGSISRTLEVNGTSFMDGNTEISAFTKLGLDAPSIKMIELSGTMSTDGSVANIPLPAGVTGDKILGVNAVLTASGIFVMPGLTIDRLEYYIAWNNSEILLIPTDSNSGNASGQPVNVTVTYKE